MSEEYRAVRLPAPIYRRVLRARDALLAQTHAGQPGIAAAAVKATLGGVVAAGLEMLEVALGLDPNAPVPPEGEVSAPQGSNEDDE